jgi:hypothetical protein
VIGGSVGPAEVGPLYHHGPELFPVVELIVGGGLPLAAALWLGPLRSVRARLGGRAGQATGEVLAEGETRDRNVANSRSRPRPSEGDPVSS